MKWQVTYKGRTGLVTKLYANMNTASMAVERLTNKGIAANISPNL